MEDVSARKEQSSLDTSQNTSLDTSENPHNMPCTKRSITDTPDTETSQKKTRFGLMAAQRRCVDSFIQWDEENQVDFVCHLLSRMSHSQHSQINSHLEPLLQRDFVSALISRGIPHISANILSYLDAQSLLAVELVSKPWQWSVIRFQLWRRLIVHRISIDPIWYGLVDRRGWLKAIQLADPVYLCEMFKQHYQFGDYHKRGLECSSSKIMPMDKNGIIPVSIIPDAESLFLENCDPTTIAHRFYKQLYSRIIRDIKQINNNWKSGRFRLTRIHCNSDASRGVYCLQYDSEKIVSGLRDDTIKVWRRINSSHSDKPLAAAGDAAATVDRQHHHQVSDSPLEDHSESSGYHCAQVIRGHKGSVLCLQYEGNLLISGSSDSTVRIWDLSTGECLNVLDKHHEAVLHLRFRNNVLVTCSKDRSIAIWDMGPYPQDVHLRTTLVGHRAAVNVVDFDDRYIVSASGDRTIKVWRTDTSTTTPVRNLTGHRRGIACLQYRAPYVVSGSSDYTIRIWLIESGVCLRVLEGHDELVRCIRFDDKRIVSGAYDGKIKIWDMEAAVDSQSKTNQFCIKTLQEHTGRVFRLQFDDFQIVSSSHDDSILIWDFTQLDSNLVAGQDDEAGAGENDDGFFNDEAALAAAANTNNTNATAPTAATPDLFQAPPPNHQQAPPPPPPPQQDF